MTLYKKDVIVALATPMGVGAIAVIRISGACLVDLFCSLSNIESPKDRHVYNVTLKSKKSRKSLDNVLITYYKGPHSFTGEDVVEISCHGGVAVSRRIIKELILYGCRYAEAGEFSKRAFLNGKIDLTQVESINQIISSKSDEEVNLGLMGLEGRTKSKLQKTKKQITDLITFIEHELDFVEGELVPTKESVLKSSIKKILLQIDEILIGSLAGKKISAGIRVAIIGPPNAGKSTLFNTLLGEDRAIVSAQKGTTRDSIEALIEISGIPVILVDTAGYWKGKDSLDVLGIKKTKEEIKISDIVVVLDETNPLDFVKELSINIKRGVFVASKSDINKKINLKKCIQISSLKNKNIKKLLTSLSTIIKTDFFPENRINCSARQVQLLEKAKGSLAVAYKEFSSNDLVQTVCLLRASLEEMKEVVGEVYNKDILNNIFAEFCVGK